jgi:hypothetical protein
MIAKACLDARSRFRDLQPSIRPICGARVCGVRSDCGFWDFYNALRDDFFHDHLHNDRDERSCDDRRHIRVLEALRCEAHKSKR